MMLPAFHGERMRRYEEIMGQAASREVATWRAGEELALLPRMQGITLEVIMRAIFGVEEGLQHDRLRALLQRLLRQTTSTGRLIMRAMLGPDSESLNASFRAALDPVDAELLPRHRRAPRIARSRRSARTSCRCCWPRATRTVARSPTASCATSYDAAARRPRDDSDDTGLDLRAPDASPRGARSRTEEAHAQGRRHTPRP